MATVLTPQRTSTQMSDEEYLAFLATRPHGERWQLIDGEVIKMNPPKLRHQKIGGTLARLLNEYFERHHPEFCALQEAGVVVPGVTRFRPQADVAVIDDQVDLDTSWADRVHLVAEVLSASNTPGRIKRKRERYMQHPLIQYVLVIAQLEARVEVFARADGWQPRVLTGLDDQLDLSALVRARAIEGADGSAFIIPLRRLYAGTPVAPVTPSR